MDISAQVTRVEVVTDSAHQIVARLVTLSPLIVGEARDFDGRFTMTMPPSSATKIDPGQWVRISIHALTLDEQADVEARLSVIQHQSDRSAITQERR